MLLANGAAIVPIVLTYFVDRAFLVITAPLWAIAILAISLLLAMAFRHSNGSLKIAPTRRAR